MIIATTLLGFVLVGMPIDIQNDCADLKYNTVDHISKNHKELNFKQLIRIVPRPEMCGVDDAVGFTKYVAELFGGSFAYKYDKYWNK